jgi:hypothetical protein
MKAEGIEFDLPQKLKSEHGTSRRSPNHFEGSSLLSCGGFNTFDLPQGVPLAFMLNLRTIRACPMRKIGMKALLTILTLNRSSRGQPDWDLIIITVSTIVTIVLVGLYIYGKSTARW